jgi:hypothetical protein
VDPSELNLDPVRGEQRRRCWAGLMLLYTIQSATLGNLTPMKLTASATVRLPADLDDEDIAIHGVQHRHTEGSEAAPPTKMSYILLKFKLYNLASDICHFARARKNWDTLLELENRICAEEQEHEARFSDGQHLPIYHVAHQYILNNYIHYLRLTLHRPFLVKHGTGSSRGGVYPREQAPHSRAHCMRSAMALLGNHEDLCCDPRFKPYRWYVYSLGSFQAFLAASTLIVLFDSEDDVTATHRAELRQALGKCLVRFENMAVRSDMCFKAAAILRKLLRGPQRTHRDLEPPVLLHQTSSTSDESEMCSINDGHSSTSHPTPMVHYTQSGVGYDSAPSKMDTSWFNCPRPMYQLMELPAEQWFGGASALAWDWTGWLNMADPQMAGHEAIMGDPGVMM